MALFTLCLFVTTTLAIFHVNILSHTGGLPRRTEFGPDRAIPFLLVLRLHRKIPLQTWVDGITAIVLEFELELT